MRSPRNNIVTLGVRKTAGFFLSSAFLVSCAGLDTRLPEIASSQLTIEKRVQEKIALSEWDSMAERLLRVGRPILLANEALCPKTGPDIGVLTHSQRGYPKRLREASARELHVGEEIELFHIGIDSPAHKAGLRRGDIIRDEKGKALSSSNIRKVLEETENLTVEREGKSLPLSIMPDTACAYRLKLSQSGAINAYADGRNIVITTGMMGFVESDAELALIIGHELAHNTMGHIRKIIGNLILSGMATRYTRPFESEADYVGLYYAKRAGYDISDVEKFWRRLAKVNPRGVGRAKSHPTFPDRYLRLTAARDEINAKLERDEPLYPNFLTASDAPAVNRAAKKEEAPK